MGEENYLILESTDLSELLRKEVNLTRGNDWQTKGDVIFTNGKYFSTIIESYNSDDEEEKKTIRTIRWSPKDKEWYLQRTVPLFKRQHPVWDHTPRKKGKK